MKRKRGTNLVVHNQKEVDDIMNESKKKKKNSKLKENNVKKTSIKNSKKIVFAIVSVLVVAIIGIISCLTIKANSDKVLVRKQVVLESGTSTKGLEQKFIEKQGNLEIKKIEYTNTNKNVKNKKELATVEVYLDSKGNVVDRDEACDKKGTEEKPKYVLKKEYTKDTHLIDVYSYDVKIIAKDGRVFKSKLVLKDTKAPKLIAKESVEVTEGDEIKADMFLERYEDASNRAHGDLYFVKEVKAKANDNSNKNIKNKTSIEKYELTDEDKKVGEHELLIVVEDLSKNISEPVKVKLIVKEKSQEVTEEEIEANGGSSNGNYSSGSRSRSGGYSGGNSGGSAGGSACGSQGYARMTPTSGMMISQSMLFAFWGCNGSESANWVPKLNEANHELVFGAGAIELDACNARYGYCQDSSIPETIYDVATGKSVGMYAPFYMHTGNWIEVGRGYMLPGRVVMTFRNY